jgi:hypothetical protein
MMPGFAGTVDVPVAVLAPDVGQAALVEML